MRYIDGMRKQDVGSSRLDEAARAGWMYYVAGHTQDQIDAKLGVSRQSAQRLVSLAMSEGLIKVRLDHPIAACMDLAERLRRRFGLDTVEVVPGGPGVRIARRGGRRGRRRDRTASAIRDPHRARRRNRAERSRPRSSSIAPMDCPQHRIVSLTGNIAPDGSAAYYNVIFGIADRIKARSFPMPLPVIAASAEERAMLHRQETIRATLDLATRADVTFVGIGDLGPDAPLQQDGFIAELSEGIAEGRRSRRVHRLGLRSRRTLHRRHHQRSRGERPHPVSRALGGHRHRARRTQAPGDPRCGTSRLCERASSPTKRRPWRCSPADTTTPIEARISRCNAARNSY